LSLLSYLRSPLFLLYPLVNVPKNVQSRTWTPAENTGHHVSGLLSFADRAAILQTGVTALELDVTEIADMPSRIFSWSAGK
jgi:hypothetical protein